MTMMEPDEQVPHFDEDDLINDYVEASMDPYEEIPDDYLMEEMEESAQIVQDIPTTKATVETTKEVSKERSFLPAVHHGREVLEEEKGGESDCPMEEINVEAAPKKHDIYSFERFKTSDSWRSKKSNIESFEAREWKRRSSIISPNGREICSKDFTSVAGSLLHHHYLDDTIIKMKPGNGISKIPLEGSRGIKMTLNGGVCAFVSEKKLKSLDDSSKATKPSPLGSCLLGVSMATLMTKADMLVRKSELGRRIKVSRKTNLCTSSNSLWVDKHAPSLFSHLLSDEQTNREVLYTIRAWDPYVFSRPAPRPLQGPQTSMTKTTPSNERPEPDKRVILLSGSPGIGKTTLAHIIAKHAGYNTVEVNASDDRSAAVLRDKVIRAMESNTLNFANGAGRPNCLILDEVDGADAKSAIASLVEIIRAEVPEKGSRKHTPFLRRPIIFICNHKHAPALRPLLPFAKHFNVDPPSNNRLAGRLREVLQAEHASASTSLLQKLVTVSGGDIRSSLHTLQFAAAESFRKVATPVNNIVDISSTLKSTLDGGLKDAQIDLARVVCSVFQKRPVKEQSTSKVLEAVDMFGNHSKTLDSLFMNLMNVSFVDPTMERCVLVHEWLSGVDHQFANQRLLQPVAIGATHLLCRIDSRVSHHLNFSTRQISNMTYQSESNRGILNKFQDGLSPYCKMSSQLLTIEALPFALWMLSAGTSLNRHVSSIDLLTTKEREALKSHVSTLRSLGITYVTSETSEGSAEQAMRLEPEIDMVVQLEGYQVPPENIRRRIPTVLQELLAHEVQRKIILNKEDSHASKSPLSQKTSKIQSKDPSLSREDKRTPKSGLSGAAGLAPANSQPSSEEKKRKISALSENGSKLKKLKANGREKQNFLGIGAQKAKASRTARKKALVGFKTKRVMESHSGSGLLLKQVIRFKYQKGFTQAVRTPCRIEDFIE